ncbi:hemerythrin domain-containing protein [Sphingomonas sp. LT1P40]|uniref:hemerythrin domain-containing protein n=1 Tax=Alteristakelama amylovorans TaxID=3096166 RepID=UPI002FC7974B
MISIERLILEHRTIATLADALSRAAPVADAASLRGMLVDLDTQLAAHLRTEDLEVYPMLLAAGDASQQIAAASAMADFDTLAADWRNYVDHWSEAAIADDPTGFIEDSAIILSALSARVRIENEVLYPLALRGGTITLREASAKLNAG